ncbi:MAG: zinc ribbon domain-containing protein [Candidatus Dormibacteria bacterium]
MAETGWHQGLLTLQDLDLQLRVARAELSALDAPTASAVERDRLTTERDGMLVRKTDLERAMRDMELEIGVERDRLRQHEKRLMGGSITSSRELTTLSAEVDQLRREVSGAEDREIEIMGEVESLEHEIAAVDSAVRAATAAAGSDDSASARRAAELRALVAQLESERHLAAAALEEGTVSLYQRVAVRRAGVAVALSRSGQCSECGLRISPSRTQQLRSDSQVVTCDGCERILVPG